MPVLTGRDMVRKLAILVEVVLILVLFFFFRGVLRDSGFSAWQSPRFGAPILSSLMLFFILPMSTLLWTRRNPVVYGLTSSNLASHARLGRRGIAFVLPATALFPVIALLGTDHEHWFGASILALGFGTAGFMMARSTRSTASIAEAPPSFEGLWGFLALLVVGVGLCYALQLVSELAARIVTVLIFVAVLEEFFFRGYVLARLNDVFARPYSAFGVDFGAGLLLSAIVFGLFHPLSVADGMPWAWALWTAVGGLIFGFLREKSGAIVAPALVHGVILVPGVLFGGV